MISKKDDDSNKVWKLPQTIF